MNIFICILAFICAVFILQLLAAPLYFKFGLMKVVYHDIFSWCTPDDSPMTFDGCSTHARCKHCSREIMQDSQGNWF